MTLAVPDRLHTRSAPMCQDWNWLSTTSVRNIRTVSSTPRDAQRVVSRSALRRVQRQDVVDCQRYVGVPDQPSGGSCDSAEDAQKFSPPWSAMSAGRSTTPTLQSLWAPPSRTADRRPVPDDHVPVADHA